ncbi:MAG TPA: FtsX-like permease family protein, partial [Bryobacteraceae bacterium]|nr:FtsX-like permease family protein [Bryobacteraceae bacterium]
NNFISVNGVNNAEKVTFLRAISPGWLTAMRMGLLDGRDLHARDQHPGVAVVNQTFGRTYFGGQNPVGRWFHIGGPDGQRTRYEIVGLTTDAKYRSMREPILPVAYLPFAEKDREGAPQPRGEATLIIRTKMTDSVALAQTLRREVVKARSEFRVSNIRTQQELVDQHTVRERLLAMLALFFAVVALLLAGIGVFGVLDYSVLQRTREIGIRLAIGASAQDVVRQITGHAFAMALGGAAVGLVLGRASEHWIKVLLYGVEATDWSTLAAPALTMLAVALLASAAPVIRALRTDPAQVLRSE